MTSLYMLKIRTIKIYQKYIKLKDPVNNNKVYSNNGFPVKSENNGGFGLMAAHHILPIHNNTL